MEYRNIYEDFYYETSAQTLDYTLYAEGAPIYYGRAKQNPTTGKIRINVAQRIRDYLHSEMPDFRDLNDVVVQHPDAYVEFALRDTYGDLLETYGVLLDYSAPFTGEDMILSAPMTVPGGKLDPRMKCFWTSFGLSARTIPFETVVNSLEITFDGDFYFPYAGGQYTICYSANTEFTAVTSSDWVSVSNSSDGNGHGCLTITVSPNTAQGANDRSTKMCLNYIGEWFRETASCYELKQEADTHYFTMTDMRSTTRQNEISMMNTGALCWRRVSVPIIWETNYDEEYLNAALDIYAIDSGWTSGYYYRGHTRLTPTGCTMYFVLPVDAVSGTCFSRIMVENRNDGQTVATARLRHIFSSDYYFCTWGTIYESAFTFDYAQWSAKTWLTASVQGEWRTNYPATEIGYSISSDGTDPEGVGHTAYIYPPASTYSGYTMDVAIKNPVMYYDTDRVEYQFDINFVHNGRWLGATTYHTDFIVENIPSFRWTSGVGEDVVYNPFYVSPYISWETTYSSVTIEVTNDAGYVFSATTSAQTIQVALHYLTGTTPMRYDVTAYAGGKTFTSVFYQETIPISSGGTYFNNANVSTTPPYIWGRNLPGNGFSAQAGWNTDCPEIFWGEWDTQDATNLICSGVTSASGVSFDVGENPRTNNRIICFYAVVILNGYLYMYPYLHIQNPFIPYDQRYLTFDVLSGGTIIWAWSTYWLDWDDEVGKRTISASTDNGTTWTALRAPYQPNSASTANTITVNAGDKVIFKGLNQTYGVYEDIDRYTWGGFNYFRGTAVVNAEGNIMSLIYGDDFAGKSLSAGTYNFLHMFAGAQRTDGIPYLHINSAKNMTLGSSSLTMCCYMGMFRLNDALTEAPLLPAEDLGNQFAYDGMFKGCQSLKYVKCLAKGAISPSFNTRNWMEGVPATGTFVKNPDAVINDTYGWTRDEGGIPIGWTVVDNI